MRRPFRCLRCKQIVGFTEPALLVLPRLELSEEGRYTVVIEQVTTTRRIVCACGKVRTWEPLAVRAV